MNRVFAAALSVPRTCVRRLSATEARHQQADITKIKKKQEHFQTDDGTPVYLKGGTSDYVMFFTTVGLIVVGLSAAAHSTYNLANKK